MKFLVGSSGVWYLPLRGAEAS
ncbi:hypothetical protein CEXT_132211, partial [Caerostris extrusa]